MGPAAGRLRRIHRQIGALEQPEQVGAVTRRDRNADAGVAAEAVAEAIERRSQRPIDPRDQRLTSSSQTTSRCTMANSSPPSRATKSLGPDRLASRRSATPFRNSSPIRWPERIVDALELVDVDVEDRELHVGGLQQQSLRVALEQRAVRQIGQRVVMGEMLDLGRDAPPLGDVFQRGGPAAVRRALVDQPDHAAVGGRHHGVVDRRRPSGREISRNRRRRHRRTNPVPGDARMRSRRWQPGLTTSGDMPNMSM